MIWPTANSIPLLVDCLTQNLDGSEQRLTVTTCGGPRLQVSADSLLKASIGQAGRCDWAIPVLGFIGTVMGLSTAIGGFAAVLQSAEDLSQIKSSLQGVTGGLATAFETTLQALVAALIIQLILTFLKKSEEEFLDECSEYCVRNVVNRLRIMPFQGDDED
jgi:hypothetical protein